jgi:GMP synthase (glutamine-hydrolysing)
VSAQKLPFLATGYASDSLGLLTGVLADEGREIHFVPRKRAGEVTFTTDRYAGLIVLGDSTNNRPTCKYFNAERRLLEAAMDAKRPVLGICLGAQLLASHQNKKRRAGGLTDLGFNHKPTVRIQVAGEGETHPVIASVRANPLVAMYHMDCFEEVDDATPLAWSTCDGVLPQCEAFRVGKPEEAVYGFQFHPEQTLGMLQDTREGYRWFDEFPPEPVLKATVAAGEQVLREWTKRAAAR